MEAQLGFKTPSKGLLVLCAITSLVLNFLICKAVGFSSPSLPIEITHLRINLMSLAAPAKPMQPIVKQQEQKPAPAKIAEVKPLPKKENISISPKVQELTKLSPAAGQKTETKKEEKRQQVASIAPVRGVGEKETNVIPLIKEVKYRRQTPPAYPRRAVEMGQQGTVLLHALISKGGDTQQIKLARSSGFGLLDKAALAAVKQWEFEPSTQNGYSIRSWVQVPVKFVLQQ